MQQDTSIPPTARRWTTAPPRWWMAIAPLAALGMSGCAVYTVVDTAVDVTATAVETTADVAAGAVDLVIPDGDDDDD